MTERPYETAAPDDLTTGTPPPSVASGGDAFTVGTPPVPATNDGTGAGVADEAKSVASDAADSGRQVAETAATGVKDVASEATTQLRQLVDQVRTELDDQASSQGQRAASGLRSLADELRQMASHTQQQGLAAEAAQQAADRAGSVADWIDNRQPGDMLDELRSLARRRPGAFLVGAAVLGLVGGRMTRGLTGDDSGSSDVAARQDAGPSAGVPTASNGSGFATSATAVPGSAPVLSEPYAVGVRDSKTHAFAPATGVGASQPLDEPFVEGRGGVL